MWQNCGWSHSKNLASLNATWPTCSVRAVSSSTVTGQHVQFCYYLKLWALSDCLLAIYYYWNYFFYVCENCVGRESLSCVSLCSGHYTDEVDCTVYYGYTEICSCLGVHTHDLKTSHCSFVDCGHSIVCYCYKH